MSSDDSFIIKKKDDLEITLRTQNADALSKFFDQPAVHIAETITGALAEGMKGVAASAGRLVQGVLKYQLLTQFAREINYFREKGRIKEDYAKDKYGFQTWVELLSVIDSEAPDEDRLKAMKAMFFAVNKINATDGERIANYQLFQIAKKLTSGQLLILRAAHKIQKSGRFQDGILNMSEWLHRIAEQLGHGLIALVEHDDQVLIDYRLLNRKNPSGDTTSGANARLTDLALKLCQTIEGYEEDMRR